MPKIVILPLQTLRADLSREGGGEKQVRGKFINTRQMDNHILKFAKSMRCAPTDAEAMLWCELRGKRFSGFKFKHQQPIGLYIADFVCFGCRLIVEIDGGQHGDSVDAERTRWRQRQGFQALRFWNNDVLNNREAVLESLLEQLSNPPPLPNPSPARGEGLESEAR